MTRKHPRSVSGAEELKRRLLLVILFNLFSHLYDRAGRSGREQFPTYDSAVAVPPCCCCCCYQQNYPLSMLQHGHCSLCCCCSVESLRVPMSHWPGPPTVRERGKRCGNIQADILILTHHCLTLACIHHTSTCTHLVPSRGYEMCRPIDNVSLLSSCAIVPSCVSEYFWIIYFEATSGRATCCLS